MLAAPKKIQQSVDEQGQEQARMKTKLELAMTNLTLVQQEQVYVTKLLQTAHMLPESSSNPGIVGAQPGGSRFPPPPPPLDRTPSVRIPFPPPPAPDEIVRVGEKQSEDGGNRRPWMPKIDFPKFDGTDARVWLDKCCSYFALYQIPDNFRVAMASIHMEDRAAL